MKTKITIFVLLFVLLNSTFLILNCFAQWEPDVRLTNASENSYTSLNNAWNIATNGNVVHVIWSDDRDGNNEVYYKRSSDDGINWGTDTRLTNNSAYSWFPSIAVSGSLVHVVWQDERDGDYEIYYKCSTDGGIIWGADTRLTNNIAYSGYPSIAVSGTLVHVVWRDFRDGNYEVYYKRSTDGGIYWNSDTRLTNTINNAVYLYPSIAISGTLVHVVWQDNRDGNREIYYKRSTDSGVNWGGDTRLTNNTSESENPSIAVSGSLVHVVWTDTRNGNGEIYFKRSTDSGINWEADTRLTNNFAGSLFPSIAVSGSLVHIVWRDYRDGNEEIYYKRSTDDGISWGTDTRLTNNTAWSENPSIAVTGSLVHVVWRDNRIYPNNEIYYKRNPTGNVGIQNISTEIPTAFSLSQNYPNPFNPTTKIRFDVAPSLSFSSVSIGNPFVSLKIYNMLGKEVTTLVNESLKPGTYSVDWNARENPSGVYFYKLRTGGFTKTKRMTLVK